MYPRHRDKHLNSGFAYYKRNRCHGCSGFTIVELLVATVVMTTALLGVYQLCAYALAAESRSSSQWRDLEAAHAVVAELEKTLVSSIHLDEQDSITARSSGSGERELICQMPDRRVRFTWRDAQYGGGTSLSQQEQPFAMSVDLSGFSEMDETEEALWARCPSILLAPSVDEILIRFQRPSSENESWEYDWMSAGEDTLAWIHVRVGQQVIDQMIWVRPRGGLVSP